jgi:hypothetical protein
VTTQTCKEVIGVIGQFLHPMKAQYLVEHYCNEIELSLDNFAGKDLPKFILYLAQQRDTIPTISDKQFFTLLSNLVYLSNSENGNANREKNQNTNAVEGEIR